MMALLGIGDICRLFEDPTLFADRIPGPVRNDEDSPFPYLDRLSSPDSSYFDRYIDLLRLKDSDEEEEVESTSSSSSPEQQNVPPLPFMFQRSSMFSTSMEMSKYIDETLGALEDTWKDFLSV